MFGADEFKQRFSGRYFGRYRAIVVDVNDPRKLGRLMVQVPVVGGKEPIGWAFPAPAMGAGPNDGGFWPPSLRDLVWVEFEEGDPSKAIWSQGPWGIREGENMVPLHARGEVDDIDGLIRDQGIIPPSAFAGTYPNLRLIKSKSGHFLEFDDTEGEERLQLAHRTGSRVEYLSDGSTQFVSAATQKERIGGAEVVEVLGNKREVVNGNWLLEVVGDATEFFEAPLFQTFQKKYTSGESLEELWSGSHTEDVVGNWNMAVGGQGSQQYGGSLSLMVGAALLGTVMEKYEMAVSNASGSPTDTAVLLHAYNGDMTFRVTDATGALAGGLITLKNALTEHILFGGDGVSEPFILGNVMVDLLKTVIDDLATHIHPTGVGPSGPPTTQVIYQQESAKLPNTLSKYILGH